MSGNPEAVFRKSVQAVLQAVVLSKILHNHQLLVKQKVYCPELFSTVRESLISNFFEGVQNQTLLGKIGR